MNLDKYMGVLDVVPKKDYFSTESKCRCGTGCGLDINEDVKYKINQIREFLGTPLYMSSGKRCGEHSIEKNKFIKNGKYTGQHYFGTAVDITCTSNLRLNVLYCGVVLGANGIAFGSNFLHLDWRDSTPTTWTY